MVADGMAEVQQVDFSVIYCSGRRAHEPSDAKAVTKQLLDGQGWISDKNCHFPQKLIIKLDSKVSLRKVQILAHHAFIATKVDMSVCDAVPEDKDDFDKLGSAAFKDNKETDFHARELKTIFLEVDALFIKLTVHRNHWSGHNDMNQVGIMAIEFFGVPYEDQRNVIHELAPNRARDLITRDHQRRLSVMSLAADKNKRMATAKARSLLDRNYAKESAKAKKCLADNLQGASSVKADKINGAIKALDNANESAMLILQQERSALSDNDELFAEACHAEVRRIFQAVYDKHDVYSLLTDKQVKSCGLDPPKPAKKTSTASVRSRENPAKISTSSMGGGRRSTSSSRGAKEHSSRAVPRDKKGGKLRRSKSTVKY